MKVEELMILHGNRIEGETITQTRNRLESEGNLPVLETEAPEEVIPEDHRLALDFGTDLVIPRYKQVQPNCRIEGATPGRFRNMLTEEEVEKLENVVFLTQQNSRSLFPQDDFSGVKRCFSYNGYVPAAEQILKKTGLQPISPVCASRENGKLTFHCPYAAWRNELGEPDENGKKQPLCKASISFVGLELLSSMPFWVIFHGAAIPIIKDFLRYINYKHEEARHQGKDLRLFDFKLNIGLQSQTTAKGKFYLPVFEKKEEITDPEERLFLRKCYDSLNGRFLSEIGRAHV